MKTYFDRLSQPEIDFLLENCNFTSDKSEDKVFIMSCKGKCDSFIANQLHMSLATVSRRKRSVLLKIYNLYDCGYCDDAIIQKLNGGAKNEAVHERERI